MEQPGHTASNQYFSCLACDLLRQSQTLCQASTVSVAGVFERELALFQMTERQALA